MLNTFALNTQPLNVWPVPSILSQWILTLDGLDLSTWDIKATNIQDDAIANLSSYDIPQDHWRGFLSYFKRWRSISMMVYIKWSDASAFQTNLDNFRKSCFTKNAILDWKRDGVIRRIKVNCTSNPQIFQHYNIDFLKVQVAFECLEPFWYELNNQSTSIFWATASFLEEITNQWTAQSNVVAYVMFWSTNSTEVKMKIWDDEITISQSFSNNDILKIDGENKIVTLNDSQIDYSWIFPFMSVWNNVFNFTINWTFSCDVLILNKINYV